MTGLNFILQAKAKDSKARAGIIETLHGAIETPVFMPVGTQATVKNQSFSSLKKCGSQMLLANTYHLLLRPGIDVFKKFGGIHSFMNWQGGVLTDSGGYQIFSLPHARTLSENGATFQSYVDGKRIHLTPELSIETQKIIGSDIMMALDYCIPSTSDYDSAKNAMDLTHRWALRSLEARGNSPQALFGIIQGACFGDLRRQSADFLSALPFDGLAIGGLAVGESRHEREDFTELTTEFMPEHLPRYLMGVGTPVDLLEAVHRGVDMFDCIIPTSYALTGVAFTSVGKVQLRRSVYKFSDSPLDSGCGCETCKNHSRGYLHHLVKTEETYGWQLIGAHNIYFYHQLMREIRESVFNQTFKSFYESKRIIYAQSEEEHPVRPPKVKHHPLEEKSAPTLGDYEIHTSPLGFSHIRHKSSGEIIHPKNAPLDEANQLYIQQSKLPQRLSEESQDPLILWDVGLGAGTNSMAAIYCYLETQKLSPRPLRPLHIFSFENNLDSLKLAQTHNHLFTYLRHGAPAKILAKGFWQEKEMPLTWTLLEGDFLWEMTRAPAPDILFFDPFSTKTDTPLWTLECFKKMSLHCREKATTLITYSASTAVRAALLAAGFFVGKGELFGPNKTSTHAHMPQALHPQLGLLGSEWLGRWERSSAKFPSDVCGPQIAEFEELIRGHRQFGEYFAGA